MVKMSGMLFYELINNVNKIHQPRSSPKPWSSSIQRSNKRSQVNVSHEHFFLVSPKMNFILAFIFFIAEIWGKFSWLAFSECPVTGKADNNREFDDRGVNSDMYFCFSFRYSCHKALIQNIRSCVIRWKLWALLSLMSQFVSWILPLISCELGACFNQERPRFWCQKHWISSLSCSVKSFTRNAPWSVTTVGKLRTNAILQSSHEIKNSFPQKCKEISYCIHLCSSQEVMTFLYDAFAAPTPLGRTEWAGKWKIEAANNVMPKVIWVFYFFAKCLGLVKNLSVQFLLPDVPFIAS